MWSGTARWVGDRRSHRLAQQGVESAVPTMVGPIEGLAVGGVPIGLRDGLPGYDHAITGSRSSRLDTRRIRTSVSVRPVGYRSSQQPMSPARTAGPASVSGLSPM